MRSLRVFVLSLWMVAVFLPSQADAVVPSVMGPAQALLALLPQLLALLIGAAVALSKPRTYRLLLRYFWAHKALTVFLAASLALAVFGFSLPGAGAGQERTGSDWLAHRGGPFRTGAAPDARGPLSNARVRWTRCETGIGEVLSIDSSPAVVGNRIYFGTSRQTPFGKSGSLGCVDTEEGRPVWTYTGQGEMEPRLQPIFASPAVAGRYLVSGEGYHEDRNCRLVCLDLEPARTSQGRRGPRLHWAKQTTSHVESSPCVSGGKAYFGAGDDGVWCIEVETGRTLWRLEGASSYKVEGPRAAELGALAGRRVAATGNVRRHWPDKSRDESELVLAVREFQEVSDVADVPVNAGNGFERTVVGKIAAVGGKVQIEIAEHYPDAESPPLAAEAGNARRLFFGLGLGGQAVVSVDADTGRLLWRTPTPFPAFGAPTVLDDAVLIGLGNGNFLASDSRPAGVLLCLSARDGKELWRLNTGDVILGAVAVCDGKAYAASRDGFLYVAEVAGGRLVRKVSLGAPMVCSPAVTDRGVFVTLTNGKVACVSRREGVLQWTAGLTPGQLILSSPVAAEHKLFVGTNTKGLFCLEEAPAAAAGRPTAAWSGPGGNAERNGAGDERGLPPFSGTAPQKWKDYKLQGRTGAGPAAVCGESLYVSLRGPDAFARIHSADGNVVWERNLGGRAREALARPDRVYVGVEGDRLLALRADTGDTLWSRDGSLPCLAGERLIVRDGSGSLAAILAGDGARIWRADLGELSGPPAAMHNLIFAAVRGPRSRVVCLDDLTGVPLWESPLPAAPLGPPTVSGSKVFVACDGRVAGLHLVDGRIAWTAEGAAASYLAASAGRVAYATAGGQVVILEAETGKPVGEPIDAGRDPQAPALVGDVVVVAGTNRLAAIDLGSGLPLWHFQRQGLLGRAGSPPMVLGEGVFLVTERKGVVGVGAPPVAAP